MKSKVPSILLFLAAELWHACLGMLSVDSCAPIASAKAQSQKGGGLFFAKSSAVAAGALKGLKVFFAVVSTQREKYIQAIASFKSRRAAEDLAAARQEYSAL